MLTVPMIVPDGVEEIDARVRFHRRLVNLLEVSGYTIGSFERLHRIPLHRTIDEIADFRGETIERIVVALKLNNQQADGLWHAFYGKKPDSVQEILQAYVRRFGYERAGQVTGRSINSIRQILFGKNRKEGPHTPPQFPPLSVMQAIAPGMHYAERAMHQRWLQDARVHFRLRKQCNAVGAEVETLLAEYDVKSNEWLKRKLPKEFEEIGMKNMRRILPEMRAGIIKRWQLMQRFCDALGASTERRKDLLAAICRTCVDESQALRPLKELPEWKTRLERQMLDVAKQAYLSNKDVETELRRFAPHV